MVTYTNPQVGNLQSRIQNLNFGSPNYMSGVTTTTPYFQMGETMQTYNPQAFNPTAPGDTSSYIGYTPQPYVPTNPQFAQPMTPMAGGFARPQGGGRDTGYYTFQGGDVDLKPLDLDAIKNFKITDLPLAKLISSIFSGNPTQNEIDTFNQMTASGDYSTGIEAVLNQGNKLNDFGPLGISGTVMNTQTDGSGDTFIGNPVTGQGVNQNPATNTVNPATATVSYTASGDRYYSGGNQGGNQGGNTGGNTGGNQSGPNSGAAGGMGEGGNNWCFDPNTLIQMEDGSEKKIKEMQIGDKTLGGEVTGVVQFKPSDEIHNYKGVIVAGSHFVKEDGKFIPVADSPHSYKIDIIPVVYSLDTTDRRIWINDIEFADFNGDGIAKQFLYNAGVDLTGFDKEVLRQVEHKLM